jgi:hypothetical protein
LFVWGPRPASAQKLLVEHKNNPNETKEEFYKKLQLWYAHDRGNELQREITTGLKQALLNSKHIA